MKAIKTNFEKALDFEIECLTEAIYHMEQNDHASTRDYAILKKKLKVIKHTSKKIGKLSAKRQKLLNKCLQHSDNLL